MGWDGPVTWRQFQAWRAWLREDNNTPNRADHYTMQVAREVRLSRGVAVSDSLDEFKISFSQRIAAPLPSNEQPTPANLPPDYYDGYPEPMTKESIAEAKLAASKAKTAKVLSKSIKRTDGNRT